jgi:hypothetical protein
MITPVGTVAGGEPRGEERHYGKVEGVWTKKVDIDLINKQQDEKKRGDHSGISMWLRV